MDDLKLSMAACTALLMKKGFSRKTINEMRIAFTADAMSQSHDLIYDRVYATCALAVYRVFHVEPEKVLEVVREFDKISGSALHGEKDWIEIMQELKDETGIVIRTGDDDRLICEVEVDDESI